MRRITRRHIFGMLTAVGAVALSGVSLSFAAAPTALVRTTRFPTEGEELSLRGSEESLYRCNGEGCTFEHDFILLELRYIAIHVDSRHREANGRFIIGAPVQWQEFDRRESGEPQANAWNDAIHGRTRA